MFIRIERGSSSPVSRQIAEQIRAQCLSGALAPGEPLPSVRQLARELAVNVNTVFRVYEQMAADKLIEMRHGDGTYVLPRGAAREKSRQLAAQREQYQLEFNAIVRRGLLLGLDISDLRRLLATAVAAEKRGNGAETPARSAKSRAVPATGHNAPGQIAPGNTAPENTP
ncbi:MAG TPA: GntR family transcriptional regulator [Planctomycetaceae bacterium]|jgi:GntR family transcriptional regulator